MYEIHGCDILNETLCSGVLKSPLSTKNNKQPKQKLTTHNISNFNREKEGESEYLCVLYKLIIVISYLALLVIYF